MSFAQLSNFYSIKLIISVHLKPMDSQAAGNRKPQFGMKDYISIYIIIS